MPTKTVEIGVGVFVALGLAALFWLAFRVSDITAFSERGGYAVTARFENIGGLKVRSPVTMAGVRIGRVAAIGFDNSSYQALVTIHLAPEYDRLPLDTSASILTAGLLGEQYIGLTPGTEDRFLKAGDEITFTQSALVLENFIGQVLYNLAAEDGTSEKPADAGGKR